MSESPSAVAAEPQAKRARLDTDEVPPPLVVLMPMAAPAPAAAAAAAAAQAAAGAGAAGAGAGAGAAAGAQVGPMDAFVNRVVAPVRGRSQTWAPAPAPAALPPMTAPLRTRLFLSGGELHAMNAHFAAAAEVEPATTKFKSLAADFAVVANAETGAYDFRLLRASAEQPDERVVGATTLVLREIIPLVFPVFKVAWKAPGGGSLNKTLKVIAARNKPRLMRMSAFARAPVALVIVDTCHVVASATWLDEMGGLGGIQADEMQLLRATLTTVAALVRDFQLICSTESKDVVRFCAEAGRFSVDDSRVFGNVFCATTAESHDYFDPAPFERAGRALTTTTFRTIDAGAAAQPQPRYFALRVHPCVVATKAQSAYDALHVVSATYTAFGDDVSATAVLGDLCDSAPYTDVADAYASAEVASAADTLSFLAAMCERGAETELANSLERAWGSKPPDVLQAALFSLATATSSATETVYMHITELVAAAWVE